MKLITTALLLTVALTLLAAGRAIAGDSSLYGVNEFNSYIISFKDGTPMKEVRQVASQMESDNGAKITHFYENVMLGFSMKLPAVNVQSAMQSLHQLPSIQMIEKDQNMKIN